MSNNEPLRVMILILGIVLLCTMMLILQSCGPDNGPGQPIHDDYWDIYKPNSETMQEIANYFNYNEDAINQWFESVDECAFDCRLNDAVDFFVLHPSDPELCFCIYQYEGVLTNENA